MKQLIQAIEQEIANTGSYYRWESVDHYHRGLRKAIEIIKEQMDETDPTETKNPPEKA